MLKSCDALKLSVFYLLLNQPEPGILGVLHGYGGSSSRVAGFEYPQLNFGFLGTRVYARIP